ECDRVPLSPPRSRRGCLSTVGQRVAGCVPGHCAGAAYPGESDAPLQRPPPNSCPAHAPRRQLRPDLAGRWRAGALAALGESPVHLDADLARAGAHRAGCCRRSPVVVGAQPLPRSASRVRVGGAQAGLSASRRRRRCPSHPPQGSRIHPPPV
ncbi:MAG: hypothetical protein AVDCRST_MAG77-5826, partial [uncultured Chloroflexi bacterium]